MGPSALLSLERHRQPPRWLTGGDLRRLLQAVPDQLYRLAFQLVLATGLRVSELTALRVDDLDPESPLLRVRYGPSGCRPDLARHHASAAPQLRHPQPAGWHRHRHAPETDGAQLHQQHDPLFGAQARWRWCIRIESPINSPQCLRKYLGAYVNRVALSRQFAVITSIATSAR